MTKIPTGPRLRRPPTKPRHRLPTTFDTADEPSDEGPTQAASSVHVDREKGYETLRGEGDEVIRPACVMRVIISKA